MLPSGPRAEASWRRLRGWNRGGAAFGLSAEGCYQAPPLTARAATGPWRGSPGRDMLVNPLTNHVFVRVLPHFSLALGASQSPGLMQGYGLHADHRSRRR